MLEIQNFFPTKKSSEPGRTSVSMAGGSAVDAVRAGTEEASEKRTDNFCHAQTVPKNLGASAKGTLESRSQPVGPTASGEYGSQQGEPEVSMLSQLSNDSIDLPGGSSKTAEGKITELVEEYMSCIELAVGSIAGCGIEDFDKKIGINEVGIKLSLIAALIARGFENVQSKRSVKPNGTKNFVVCQKNGYWLVVNVKCIKLSQVVSPLLGDPNWNQGKVEKSRLSKIFEF